MKRATAVAAIWFGLHAGTAWAVGACVGDCSGDGAVTVNELVSGVNIALGNLDLSHCLNFDRDHDLQVKVNELVAGVNAALNGCLFLGSFYGTTSARIDGVLFPAVLNLTAQADGTVTGTMTIRDGSGGSSSLLDADGEAAAVIAIGSLSGTVDFDTGGFTMDGAVTIGTDYPIHINGTLPGLGGGSGTFSGQIGVETFSGSIVSGDGSTPTPTRTHPPTSTPTPTATMTPTHPAATATPTSTNTVPPLPTATPTTAIIPPGISAQMLGIWSGSAQNDSTGEHKNARIKIEVKNGQVVVTDLAGTLWNKALTVTVPTPTALYYNHLGSVLEALQLALAPDGLLGGTYSTTTVSFPPTVHALALVLTKES